MAASPLNIELPARYRPLRHIANGGMAAVWAAEDCLLGREVAIKVLAAHLAENDRARMRFKREARTAAGLSNHPHAITIYDVGEHEGRSFIVMESLPGGSLADRLGDRRRIGRKRALQWLRDAASGLDAAHERGIVHRDVKPGNMLFDGHDRLVLADFGIARLAYDSTVTTTGDVLGTAAYVSPEQADGRPAAEASDRYSLAVVAYELLTGTRPFRADHFAATARLHIEAAPDPPSRRDPSLPPEVDAVLLRGLAKDPAERWPTATAFVEALEETLSPPAVVDDGDRTMPLPPPPPLQEAPPAAAASAREPALPEPPRRPAQPSPPPAPRRPGPRSAPRRPASPAPASSPTRPAPPSGKVSPPTVHRARRLPGWLLPAALVGVLALVAVAVVLAAGGGEPGDQADSPAREAQSSGDGERSSKPAKPSESSEDQQATPAPSSERSAGSGESPSADDGGTPSGGATSGASPAALNEEGFRLLSARRYDEAVPVLERAYEACGKSVGNLTCAFAAFNLGQALRLAGRPDEAIPVLEKRLENPNQRDTVKAELDAAKRAAKG
ncbi:MAG: serine/threonine-protein kinase [Solirubrobacteraceae bacterium]